MLYSICSSIYVLCYIVYIICSIYIICICVLYIVLYVYTNVYYILYYILLSICIYVCISVCIICIVYMYILYVSMYIGLPSTYSVLGVGVPAGRVMHMHTSMSSARVYQYILYPHGVYSDTQYIVCCHPDGVLAGLPVGSNL